MAEENFMFEQNLMMKDRIEVMVREARSNPDSPFKKLFIRWPGKAAAFLAA